MRKNFLHKGIALFLSAFFLLSQAAMPVSAAESSVPAEEITNNSVQIDSEKPMSGDSISQEVSDSDYESDTLMEEDHDSSATENPSDISTESDSVTASDSVSDSDDRSHEEEINQEGSDISIEAASDNKEQTKDASGSLQITDVNQDEKSFRITMNSYTMPANGSQLIAAVWSDQKGQDDLRWYAMTSNSNHYDVNIEIKDHKTPGIYNVHIYQKLKDGTMQFICKDTFSVTAATMGSVEIIQDSSDLSKATVLIHDVSAPSGISGVTVPVWSRPDQKDIVWYQATKKDEKTWTVELSYNKHVNCVGNQFHVHIYATSGNNIFSKIGQTTAQMEKAKPSLSVKITATGTQLSSDNCSINNPKDIRYAVWSTRNGQDDLKWYIVPVSADGSSTTIIPFFKETGEYNIHCYAMDQNGKMVFQEKTTYTADIPSAGSISVIENDAATGSFTLSVADVQYPDMVKEITVPVWSAPNQSDLVWYKAAKQTDGTWQVKGSVFNHKGNAGRYIAHVYVKDITDTSRFSCSTEFHMEVPPLEVNASYNINSPTVDMTAFNVNIPDGVKEVRFAVWTKENGQDDLRWYTARYDNGIYRASANMENHKGSGPLIIHAYAESTKKQLYYLKPVELPISTNVSASFRFDEFSEERFSGEMYVDLKDHMLGIKKVELAVWSAPDQSDLYWYNAERTSEDTWHAAFTPIRHKGLTGTFHVHAYVTFSNGVRVFAGKDQYSASVSNKQYVLENADGTVTAVLYTGKTLNNPTIAVWSQQDGQDDLKWYPLTFNGTCYSANLSIRNHKHNGLYYGHFYGDSMYQGGVTFTFPEMLTSTETVSKTQSAGHSDVKFYNKKLLCSIGGKYLALRNLDGSIFRNYMDLPGFWLDTLESEGLIVYTNQNKQLEIARLDSNYNLMWKRVIAVMPNLTIDPCIVKNGNEYLITATEIQGNVNNSDPHASNGNYTIHSWKSTDLVNWTEFTDVTTENHNLEEIKMVEKDGILYMAYEREVIDKGNSSILARVSYDNGSSWSDPIELLPADSDHEICNLSVNGDRFVLFYSSDKDSIGSSYMGAKAYYAVYDKDLKCISRDVEIKTGATGGILMYDVTWIDSTHYILYSENYLTTGTLVVEKAK